MKIIVCPLEQVETVLLSAAPSDVVTLLSPGTVRPACLDLRPDLRTLALAFHDIVEEQEGLTAPDESHVAQLLAFLSHRDPAAPILIHCWAGVSRSPAAAFITACLYAGSGQEQILAQRLRAEAPFATPNPRLVRLADQLMDRGGSMIRAVEAIGRGHDCDRGHAFALTLHPSGATLGMGG